MRPLLLAALLLAVPARPAAQEPRPAPPPATATAAQPLDRAVVVASKPFGENYILAEMFAQLLEEEGFSVDRRFGMGYTEIAFGGLQSGAIDLYPEYTGTGLVAILGLEPRADARAVFRTVYRTFDDRWGIRWLPPLGFENTYAITIRPETARQHGIRTLSQLARVAPELTAGFSPDFIGREDGLPGLQRAYDFEPGQVRSLVQSVKYQALVSGEVDVIDGYSTDGFIARYDLEVLEDDRGFFPSYEAAALVSRRLRAESPYAVSVLTRLSGTMDEALMRRLNQRLEVDGEALTEVARAGLRELGLLAGSGTGDAAETGAARHGILPYMWARRARLAQLTLRHLLLVSVSLCAAILIAVPMGLLVERLRAGAEGAIRGVGLLQTIPSIALLAFMIPLMGIGVLPALVALFLYSLYPILRNTYTGVRDASPDAVNAARALGMTPGQVLRHVRLPLAAPVLMAGIRTAAVINVGTATLAAFIGAGGLGDPIVSGLSLSDTRMILSGAIPAAALALVVDATLGGVERMVSPRL